MSKLVVGALCGALVVAGCASNPRQTLGTLNAADPKFETQACLDARNIAMQYNDKVISRAGMGLALGLLGPIGIVGAVMIDANQNNERKTMNEEVLRRCQTAPVVATPTEPTGVSPQTASDAP